MTGGERAGTIAMEATPENHPQVWIVECRSDHDGATQFIGPFTSDTEAHVWIRVNRNSSWHCRSSIVQPIMADT